MGARLTAAIVTLSCLLPAAFSATASAETVASGTLWAGGSAYLAMDLVAPASLCELLATAPGRTPQVLSALKPSETRVAWVWKVPVRARTANWQVTAVCGSSHLRASYVVHGPRRRSVLSLARQIRVLQYGGSFPAPTQLQLGVIHDLARSWWTRVAPTILTRFHSGIASGQCTDYVATKRPDVIQNVDIWAYTNFLLAHGGPLNVDWTARNWVLDAQSAGLSTGHVPEAGAVAVFQPGAYGAHSEGHVAIVDSVHSDGGFTLSEMHAPVIGRVTTRNFSAAEALAMLSNPRIGFIYR
jgi:surface antigen